MSYVLHLGNCLEVLRGIDDCSFDSIVTDPPYGLSFMGKRWDYDVPSVEVWAECLRVLKPGGHLLAFAGTRTQHRMAVRIEDAGFEIRDMIAWIYASGFPKSHNMDNHRGATICGCAEPYTQNGAKQKTQCNLRPVRSANVSTPQSTGEKRGKVLQPSLPEQGAPTHRAANCAGQHERPEQSGMEGRCNASQAPWELRSGAVHQSASVGATDGPQGWLCDGAPADDGGMVRLPADADGGCAPRGPRPTPQCEVEPGAMAGQSQPQAVGAWPVCRGCGLPVVPRGLGTALKPALEPITVARKPLVGTVAANVLAHGTGALNIDGCRVGTESTVRPMGGKATHRTAYGTFAHDAAERMTGGSESGRWPANLIHDGSDEVVALAGDAARFFYCAKASKRDRDEGLEGFEAKYAARDNGFSDKLSDSKLPRANLHPTVKPTDLMRYLCRLVTPPGGVVLDPFMGSGSTGKAAILEGFQFCGVEMNPEYMEIARARIDAAVPKPEAAANDNNDTQKQLFA